MVAIGSFKIKPRHCNVWDNTDKIFDIWILIPRLIMIYPLSGSGTEYDVEIVWEQIIVLIQALRC